MNTDEPKPEAKATAPKPEAAGPKPDPKAIELTHDNKAAESPPEIKAQTKPEVQPEAKVATKPKTEVKAGESRTETKSAAPRMVVGNKIIFTIAIIGILAGLVAAYIFGLERKAQPPVFKPVSNPF